MQVTIVDATENPIDIISRAAGSSTRKDDVRYKRVERCILDRHSVHEFADVTFKIEGISRACYDKETEILTYDGWKYFKDVQLGEKVLTFNSKTKQSEFQPVENIIAYHYDGDMHYYHSQSVNLLVTPNHNMWMKKYDVKVPDSFHLVPSEDINVKRFYFDKRMKYKHLVSSDFILPEVQYYRNNKNGESYLKILPEQKFNKDDVMKLLAWYIGEGSSHYSQQDNTWRIFISQLKQKNYDKIKYALQSCGLSATISYHNTENGRIPVGFSCGSRQWGEFLNKCGHTAATKKLPFENLFEEFDAHTAKVFIDEYLSGDGSIDINGCGKLYTSSPVLADQLYTLCYMAGYTAAKTIRYENEIGTYRKGPNKQMIKCNHPSYIIYVSLNGKRNYRPMIQKKNNFDIVDYHGNVYCVTVPNHIIFVRRSGKAVWCGNCLAQLTRHRLASYCVESQRYNKYDLNNENWYVIPPDIKNDKKLLNQYRIDMAYAASQYQKMLNNGIKAEDARFILPEATKTNLHMKINARSLFNLFEQRRNPHAQWEIHELADAMIEALRGYNEQWNQMMDIYLDYEQESLIK